METMTIIVLNRFKYRLFITLLRSRILKTGIRLFLKAAKDRNFEWQNQVFTDLLLWILLLR